MQSKIIDILNHIGENPTREGLVETPNRVVKSWKEIYKGYSQNPADVFTTFDSGAYNQIVLLKDCELYSMCEHHMLPFYGKIHIAYIPTNKVIGISKLARLADIYSRRLQIQERIGEQITNDLMTYLQPLGAAVIIEASHMCMRMRGVEKQHSIMVTSSMRGVFLDKPEARMELMQLIKG
jgi:GTP cyclohydrolase IA